MRLAVLSLFSLFLPSLDAFVGHASRLSLISLPSTATNEPVNPSELATSFEEPDMKAYASGYRTVFEELPVQACSASTGEIPQDLRGSYFRTGPAMFSAGSIKPPKTSIVQPKQDPVADGENPERMVKHPMEADGAVLAVTFAPKTDENSSPQVTARFRYVRTTGFTNERKKGAKLYEGMDSTRSSPADKLANDLPLPLYRHHLMPGLNKKRKHTANTRSFYWGKRLMTLWEGGQPYKIDSLALSTEGRSRLGGAIPKDTDPFGSKFCLDSKTKHALFYAVEVGAKNTELALYEFDSNFALVDRSLHDLPGLAVLNDFAITENYAIFFQPDLAVNNMKFIMSKDPGATLTRTNGASSVHLVPRAGSSRSSQTISVPTDAMSPEANLQFVNAYEDGDMVIVDVVRSDANSFDDKKSSLSWPWGETLQEYRSSASKKSLWRYQIDAKKGTVISKEQIFRDHCMFGVVNPAVSAQRHTTIYMNIGATGEDASPPQGIAAVDCTSGNADVWMPKSFEFCGEPMYAPRCGQENSVEDTGYILSILFNGRKQTSEIIILEAERISKGPIARLPLSVTVPHGFFGCFTTAEEATWSFEDIQRRAKLADKMESRGNMWNEVKSDFSGLGLRFDDFEEYFGMDMNDFFTPPKSRK